MESKEILDKLLPVLSPAAIKLFEPLLINSRISLTDMGYCCELDVGDGSEAETLILIKPRIANSKTPEQLRQFFSVCGGLEMGEPGKTGQLILHNGYDGTLATLGLDAWSRKFPFPYSNELCAPIDIDMEAFYVIDPRNGQICFKDEGILEVVRDCTDLIEIYLREVYYRLKVYEPKTKLQKIVSNIKDRHEWLEEI